MKLDEHSSTSEIESWCAALRRPSALRHLEVTGAEFLGSCSVLFSREDVERDLIAQHLLLIGSGIGDLLWERPLLVKSELASTAGAASWLRKHADSLAASEQSQAFGFWHSVLRHIDAEQQHDSLGVLSDSFFGGLLLQLAAPGRLAKLSALHGINHLRHELTGAAVPALLSRQADPEVRSYAAIALRFEAD